MSCTVSWNLQLTVRDGRLDSLKSLMQEMVESTKAEPGTLAYEWFLSEDGTICHLYERYADAEAAMIHIGTFGAKFMGRFMECTEQTALHVYGDPGDQVRGAMSGFGAVFLRSFGGVAR